MSAKAETLAALPQLLKLQAQVVGRPSADVCATIAGLKDLCDLQSGGGGGNDWRRGTGGGGGSQGWRRGAAPLGGQGQGSGTPRSLGGFRSESSFASLASAGGGGGSPSPLGMHRSGSQASVGGGGGSPTSAGSAPTPRLGPGPPQRYQSQFKNSAKPVEDKILNNIILSKLNKFSPATYNDIRDFLYQILGSGEPDLAEMIRDFMRLVFRKAAAEELYCALYAKLLAEISGRYSVILEEMHTLQANYLDIFEDIKEVAADDKDYEKFVAKNNEKKYRQGYSQFLAELVSHEIMQIENLVATYRHLFELMRTAAQQPEKKGLVEEYADCISRMSRVLKGRSAFQLKARQELGSACAAAIESLVEKKEEFISLSPKARFTVMNVRDILSQRA